jgi:hypothetical protein
MLKKLILLIAVVPMAAQASEDSILYRFRGENLRTGAYGAVAKFQAAMNEKLATCLSPNNPVKADGVFGAGTQTAIKRLSTCYKFEPPLSSDSAAFQGAITTQLWKAVLNGAPVPSADARAQDLTMVFEDTDFTDLEFNYCQSHSSKTGKTWAAGDPECYSNDPCSFATWGPRGATVGGGHEIQTILWEVKQRKPDIVNSAFGGEIGTLDRLLDADKESAELILCSAYADPQRRVSWKDAFNTLGKEAIVHSIYNGVYMSTAADGAKMLRFYKLYQNLKSVLGHEPTEVDNAFFIDRSTHGGVPSADELQTLTRDLTDFIAQSDPKPSPAQLRWKLAQLVPVGNQKEDRLGRDVVYVYDGMGAKVGQDAITAWENRGPYLASDFGLSDERFMQNFVATTPNGYEGIQKRNAATTEDRATCPAIVLRPINPNSGKTVICSQHQ